MRLAWVFGNEAPGGRCPFYTGGLCTHCDIGRGEGRAFDERSNRRRWRWLRRAYCDQIPDVRHLVLYNSGSILNPREFTWKLLLEVIAWAASETGIRVVSLDSRESFVRAAPLVELAANHSLEIRPILGVESANDAIRNGLLRKQMPQQAIEATFAALHSANQILHCDRTALDINVVVGGPGAGGDFAAGDAVATAAEMLRLAEQYQVRVDMNLHAFYPSQRSRKHHKGHPRCPMDAYVAAAHRIAIACRRAGAGVFLGWEDEGHDQQPTERERELARWRPRFDRFNRTQDPALLA